MLAATGPPAQLPGGVARDVWRMSLVMGVAAVDTYMHRLVVERAYTHDKLPGKLARLEMTFEQLLAKADDAATAARAAPRNTRPRVGVKRQLRDRLLRETFQSYDDVATALGMSGMSGNWDPIGKRLNPTMTPKQIKRRLNGIVFRRNQIVHEGDYERLDRPQRATLNPVNHTQIAADLSWLGDLVDAIDAVT
jgi:hypothetical protein